MKLSVKEEELMEHLWKSERSFLKEIIENYPEPKPASTTLLTLLNRMQEKGFVGFEQLGNSRRYYPLVKKEDYFSDRVGRMIQNFFNDSALQFASFFTASAHLNKEELEKLKGIIDTEIKKREK